MLGGLCTAPGGRGSLHGRTAVGWPAGPIGTARCRPPTQQRPRTEKEDGGSAPPHDPQAKRVACPAGSPFLRRPLGHMKAPILYSSHPLECQSVSERRADRADQLSCAAPFAERLPSRDHFPALPNRRCCAARAICRHCRRSAAKRGAGPLRADGAAPSGEAPGPGAQPPDRAAAGTTDALARQRTVQLPLTPAMPAAPPACYARHPLGRDPRLPGACHVPLPGWSHNATY